MCTYTIVICLHLYNPMISPLLSRVFLSFVYSDFQRVIFPLLGLSSAAQLTGFGQGLGFTVLGLVSCSWDQDLRLFVFWVRPLGQTPGSLELGVWIPTAATPLFPFFISHSPVPIQEQKSSHNPKQSIAGKLTNHMITKKFIPSLLSSHVHSELGLSRLQPKASKSRHGGVRQDGIGRGSKFRRTIQEQVN